jgi:hypothetical protein
MREIKLQHPMKRALGGEGRVSQDGVQEKTLPLKGMKSRNHSGFQ